VSHLPGPYSITVSVVFWQHGLSSCPSSFPQSQGDRFPRSLSYVPHPRPGRGWFFFISTHTWMSLVLPSFLFPAQFELQFSNYPYPGLMPGHASFPHRAGAGVHCLKGWPTLACVPSDMGFRSFTSKFVFCGSSFPLTICASFLRPERRLLPLGDPGSFRIERCCAVWQLLLPSSEATFFRCPNFWSL